MSNIPIYSTVYIIIKEKGEMFSGTGFIMRFIINNIERDFLITNKHVLSKNCEQIIIWFKLSNEDGVILDSKCQCRIHVELDEIFYHPDDAIDLCAFDLNKYKVYLNNLINMKTSHKHNIYYEPITENDIINNTDLSLLEDVLIVGYPSDRFDNINYFPVIKRGSTASHPCIDYKKNPEILIDCLSIPGFSGSPVFLLHDMKLIGIITSGYQYNSIISLPLMIKARELFKIKDLIKSYY